MAENSTDNLSYRFTDEGLDQLITKLTRLSQAIKSISEAGSGGKPTGAGGSASSGMGGRPAPGAGPVAQQALREFNQTQKQIQGEFGKRLDNLSTALRQTPAASRGAESLVAASQSLLSAVDTVQNIVESTPSLAERATRGEGGQLSGRLTPDQLEMVRQQGKLFGEETTKQVESARKQTSNLNDAIIRRQKTESDALDRRSARRNEIESRRQDVQDRRDAQKAAVVEQRAIAQAKREDQIFQTQLEQQVRALKEVPTRAGFLTQEEYASLGARNIGGNAQILLGPRAGEVLPTGRRFPIAETPGGINIPGPGEAQSILRSAAIRGGAAEIAAIAAGERVRDPLTGRFGPTPGGPTETRLREQLGILQEASRSQVRGPSGQLGPQFVREFAGPTGSLTEQIAGARARRFEEYASRGLGYQQALAEEALITRGGPGYAGGNLQVVPGMFGTEAEPRMGAAPVAPPMVPMMSPWARAGGILSATGGIIGSAALYGAAAQGVFEGLNRYAPEQINFGPFSTANPFGVSIERRNAQEQADLRAQNLRLNWTQLMGDRGRGFLGSTQVESINLGRQEDQTVIQHKLAITQMQNELTDLNKGWVRSYRDATTERTNLDRSYEHERQGLANSRFDNDLRFSREQLAASKETQRIQLGVSRTQEDFNRTQTNLYTDASLRAREFARANEDLAQSMVLATRQTQRQREELGISYALSQRTAARGVADEALGYGRSNADLARSRAREQQDYQLQLTRTQQDIATQRAVQEADRTQRVRELKMQQQATGMNQFLAVGGLLGAAQSGDPFAIIGALFRMQQLQQEKQLTAEQLGRGGLSPGEVIQRQAEQVKNQQSLTDLTTQHGRATEDLSTNQSRLDEDHVKAVQRAGEDQSSNDEAHSRALRIIGEDQATNDIQAQKAQVRLNQDITSATEAFGKQLTQLVVDYNRAMQDASVQVTALQTQEQQARQDFETNVQRYTELENYQVTNYNAAVQAINTNQQDMRQDYDTALGRMAERRKALDDQFGRDMDQLALQEKLHAQTRILNVEQLNLTEAQNHRLQMHRLEELDAQWRSIVLQSTFALGLNTLFLGQFIGSITQLIALTGLGAAGAAGGSAIVAGARGLPGVLSRLLSGAGGAAEAGLTDAEIAARLGGPTATAGVDLTDLASNPVGRAAAGGADAASAVLGLIPLQYIISQVEQSLSSQIPGYISPYGTKTGTGAPASQVGLGQFVPQAAQGFLALIDQFTGSNLLSAVQSKVPAGASLTQLGGAVDTSTYTSAPEAPLSDQFAEPISQDEIDAQARVDKAKAAVEQAQADADHFNALVAQQEQQNKVIDTNNKISQQQWQIAVDRVDELNRELALTGSIVKLIDTLPPDFIATIQATASGQFGTVPVTPPTPTTPRHAGGGIIPGQTWLVDPMSRRTYATAGENGPETIVPGTVYNSDTGQWGSGGANSGAFRGGSLTPQGTPMLGANGEAGVFITDFVDPMGRGTSGHWEPLSGGAAASDTSGTGGSISIRQTGVPMGFHSDYRGEDINGPGGPNQTYTTQLGASAGFQSAQGDTSGIASAMSELTQQISSLQRSLTAQPQALSKAALNNHIVGTLSSWLDSGMVG